MAYVLATGGRLPTNLAKLLRDMREIVGDVTENEVRAAIRWALRQKFSSREPTPAASAKSTIGSAPPGGHPLSHRRPHPTRRSRKARGAATGAKWVSHGGPIVRRPDTVTGAHPQQPRGVSIRGEGLPVPHTRKPPRVGDRLSRPSGGPSAPSGSSPPPDRGRDRDRAASRRGRTTPDPDAGYYTSE